MSETPETPEAPETPKILDQLSKSNTAKARGRNSRQQNAKRRIAVIIVLVLPVLTGVLFLAYQQRMLQLGLSALTQENQQLSLALSVQATQLQQLQSEFAEPPQPVPVDDSAVHQLQSDFNAEVNRLRQQLAEVQSQLAKGSVEPNLDWKLLEAEYLLGMASQKLLLEADSSSAIALLENADASLLASGSNTVHAVRQAISAELIQLRNIDVIDRQGLYIRIGNLAMQLSNVELLDSVRQNFENYRSRDSEPVEIDASTSGNNATKGWLDASLEFLGSVFIWRKWEESPTAMLAAGTENTIKQNLLLMFEQAQLALLMRDSELYRQSLGKSREWIRSYVATDTVAGQAVLDDLLELEAIDIDPLLPPLSQSLELIRQVNASQQSTSL